MMSKLAFEKIAQELAPIEARDRDNAVELGFCKVAQELGMDAETYKEFREFAIKLQNAK